MDVVIPFRCPLPLGLHARPASRLVAVCAPFLATVRWKNLRNGREANLRSPLALLGTDTLFGDPCEIRIDGADAGAAGVRIERFLACELGDDRSTAGTEPPTPSLAGRPKPIIDTDCIALDCDWGNRQEVIAGLVGRLSLAGRVRGRTAMERTLWERERQSATGVGFGIALPHARTPAVCHSSIAIAKLREPVDWPAVDGHPVHTVIMLAMGMQAGGEKPLLPFSRLARCLLVQSFRDRLQGCADARTVLALMTGTLMEEEVPAAGILSFSR